MLGLPRDQCGRYVNQSHLPPATGYKEVPPQSTPKYQFFFSLRLYHNEHNDRVATREERESQIAPTVHSSLEQGHEQLW